MKIHEERKLIEAALDKYRSRLDEISDEQFDLTPPGGGWSYAEVYAHILQADFGSLIAAEKCARKTGTLTGKGTNLFGKFVLLTGIFPRIKTTDTIASAVKKIDKEEARNLIIRVRSRLETLVPLLQHAPPDYKIKHPRMGMLNAGQWLKFVRIHTEHHLKQLDRIERELPLPGPPRGGGS